MHFQTASTTAAAPPHLLLCLCLALAIVIGTPTGASAATAQSVTVRYGDLDLSSTTDAHTLLRRLERAADVVCEGAIARSYMAKPRAFRDCYRKALADAVARLDAPLVYAHYAHRHAMRG